MGRPTYCKRIWWRSRSSIIPLELFPVSRARLCGVRKTVRLTETRSVDAALVNALIEQILVDYELILELFP